jgi:glycerate kinase
VVALAGSINADEDALRQLGLSAWASIAVGPSSVDEMCGNAGVLLERAAAGMMRWLNLGRLLAVEPRRKGVHRASGC